MFAIEAIANQICDCGESPESALLRRILRLR
jgi:hypothetical protein